MNEEQRFFDVSFFPAGSSTMAEETVRATSGLEAIEKIKRLNGEKSLIVNITEVEEAKEVKPIFFLDTSNLPISDIPPSSFRFMGKNNEPILTFEANGDIYVHGRLVVNDEEVVDGLRAFLAGTPYWRD